MEGVNVRLKKQIFFQHTYDMQLKHVLVTKSVCTPTTLKGIGKSHETGTQCGEQVIKSWISVVSDNINDIYIVYL